MHDRVVFLGGGGGGGEGIQFTFSGRGAASGDPWHLATHVQAQEPIEPALHPVPLRVADGLGQAHLFQQTPCVCVRVCVCEREREREREEWKGSRDKGHGTRCGDFRRTRVSTKIRTLLTELVNQL